MDPEEILRFIEDARQKGMTDKEINARLPDATDGQFSRVGEVQAAAEGAQLGQEQARQDDSAVNDFIRLLSSGVAGNFLDEGAGLLAGVGAAIVPGGQGFSEARAEERARSRAKTEAARERRGLLGTAANVVGGAVPGATVLRGIRAATGGANAAKGIGGLLTSGKATTPLRTMGRGAARLGAVGGIESGLFAAGNVEGGLQERAAAARDAALIGAPVSAALGAAGSALPAAKRALGRPSESGQRLAGLLRQEGQVAAKPSVIRESIDQAKKSIQRRGFQPLEQAVEEVNSPRVRQALDSDDVNRVVEDLFPAVAKGERAPSFLELQKVQQRLKGLRERAFRSGDSFDVNKFQEAERRVLESMEEAVEGFPEARRAWARQMQRMRALEEGRKVASKSADDIGSALENLPNDRQVRTAFREGVAHDIVSNLEGGEAGVRTFVKNAKNNTQLRQKLIAVLGGPDKADNFLSRVEVERGVIRKADLVEELIKAAGFLGLGTSLFGTAAVGQLQ